MITALSHTTVWVLDHDEALEFYTESLGFEVRVDERMDDFRWLTLGPPSQPDHQLILLEPGPPMMDADTAEQVKGLVAKGVLGSGVFRTDDCRATYAELSERGVNFLSEPAERFYGVEATLRDNSGNWFSMTQPSRAYPTPNARPVMRHPTPAVEFQRSVDRFAPKVVAVGRSVLSASSPPRSGTPSRSARCRRCRGSTRRRTDPAPRRTRPRDRCGWHSPWRRSWDRSRP
jgi:catechol 2,3-dioxygenase-like lactoylglutathione lyase family enzyme